MTTPTLDEQIAELKRELALRERAFPRFVASGRMKQAEADRSMARMKAALHTLLAVQAVMRDGARVVKIQLQAALDMQREPRVAVRPVGPHGEPLP
ncbi:hypothetical protein [Caldovatus aquaticus]|uniref:50S ribosomal protein L29 n=1 Tax=Caldovatus aquaticus TaxID=2865671 RepID=A0ABS7EY72_9PROT|nr:hypothetical protein [Caldovatus aquaticus]MBW8268317.1 hypothetical protein [Caldovatus aquaticus]